MKNEIKGDIVIAYPEGRISSDTAKDFFEEFQGIISENEGRKFEINMEGVEYVSSAGLRIFLNLKKTGVDMKLTELRPEVYDIFEMTDFTSIMNVKKAMRRISVDGCEVIGRGFYGTVYRIDDDTIVKAYNSPDSIPMIENEQRKAKLAFKSGIPTAISYDIVRVGDSYGSVFELLKAKTVNDIIIESAGNTDEIIQKYVEFIKLVHDTTIEPDTLPDARDIYLDYLDTIKEYITNDMYEKLTEHFKAMPADNHIAHGDIQMKNVMMVDGEPMLIDMDTLMEGNPIFDLAGLYVTYQEFKEDEPDNTDHFLGITGDMADHIWNEIVRVYFGDTSDEERSAIVDRIRIVAAVRFLYIIAVSDLKNGELGATRIEHTRKNLEELIPRVDGLIPMKRQ